MTLGAFTALFLTCVGAAGLSPSVALAATRGTTPSPVTLTTGPTQTTLDSDSELATTLMQTISQFDQVRDQLAENEQQQKTLQSQVRNEQARVQTDQRQIQTLTARASLLTIQERWERGRMMDLVRAIYIDPSTAVVPTLLPMVASSTLGTYLTQQLSSELALNRTEAMVHRLDSERRHALAARASLRTKRTKLTAEVQTQQTSQTKLRTQDAQLQSQEEQVASRWSQSMTEVAAVRTEPTLTTLQSDEMSAIGTGSLDQQTLDAGLAAGMYALSNTTQIQWPAQPDPSPLSLDQYTPYCQYTPIQCTCYAANAYQKYTGGTLPEYLGNGGQWFQSAQSDGIPTTQTPTEGSVVVFSGPEYSAEGHVALVRSLIYNGSTPVGLVVWERNFDEQGSFDVRIVSLGAGDEIAGYILPGV